MAKNAPKELELPLLIPVDLSIPVETAMSFSNPKREGKILEKEINRAPVRNAKIYMLIFFLFIDSINNNIAKYSKTIFKNCLIKLDGSISENP